MIEARAPIGDVPPASCEGCAGSKGAPIAIVLSIYNHVSHHNLGVTIALCEECGRDTANAVGFMCVREGGWSKLKPRKRKTKTPQNEEGTAR